MSNSVKFDTGIGDLVVDLFDFAQYFYSQLSQIRSKYEQNTFFYSNSLKIKKYMKNNIAFYFGCLLWAYYLNKNNENSPKDIEDNVFLNLTEEQLEQYDYLSQVTFLQEFFVQFEKDVFRFTKKKYEIPTLWKKIVNLYAEFLTLNEGFVNTKTTADIKLPKEINSLNIDFDINSYIQKAINNKNLDMLLELDILS